MSSHHFVKEGQEPALFIMDAISLQRVEPLLEWVPLVIVSEGALEHVLSWGIKIDVVLHQHLKAKDLEALVDNQFPIELIPIADDDVMERAMTLLTTRHYHAVNVVTADTRKLFRIMGGVSNSIQVGVYNEQEKWSFISNGTFEKWMPAGSILLLWHMPGLTFQTAGVEKVADHWGVLESGMVKFSATGPFWVGEPSLPVG